MLDLLRASPVPPFHQLVEHFKTGGWHVDEEPESQIVHLGFEGEPRGFRYAAAIKEKPPIVLFFTIFPKPIAADKLPAIVEFCSRVNWGLTLGRFELGWDEGQLRFQSGAPFSSGMLDDEILQTVVRLNVTAADFYFNAVDLILKFDISACEALRLVEQGQNQDDS